MGLVGALQTLPDLVFGMVAGVLADRSDRKRMMFLADLGRAFLTALIPLSVLLGGPTMAVILVVAAPMSVLRSFFLAGYTASVPALVGRPHDRPGQLLLRGGLLDRLHPRPRHRRSPRLDDRPGPTLAIDAVSFASVRDRPALRPAGPARPDRPAARAPRDRDPRGHRLHRQAPDPAHRDPVLGRDLDPHRAARHRARRPRHPRPRLRRRGPGPDPHRLRRRDRRRGPDHRETRDPAARRAVPARRQSRDGGRSGGHRDRAGHPGHGRGRGRCRASPSRSCW